MFRLKIPKQFYTLFLISGVIFFLGLGGIFKPIRRLAEKKIIIPIRQKIFDWRQFSKRDSQDCSLTEEKLLTEMRARIAFLEEENRQQKRLLSSPLPKGWQFQTVKVVGAENETLLVSSGKEDNVKEGMVAIDGDTYLGKIYQVGESISKVRLPSFLDEKLVVAIISKESRFLSGRGLLEGRGEGGMRVEQILLSENISEGDIVQTDFLGTNLVIGTVSEVIEKKGEMFKSALVKRLYNPQKLETIFLIKN